ncbi:hypothetical protein Tco_0825918 [Tanacetum coccineum]
MLSLAEAAIWESKEGGWLKCSLVPHFYRILEPKKLTSQDLFMKAILDFGFCNAACVDNVFTSMNSKAFFFEDWIFAAGHVVRVHGYGGEANPIGDGRVALGCDVADLVVERGAL